MSEKLPHEEIIRPTSMISLADVADLWRYRELVWTLTSRDVRVRYKQAAFGVLWAVIQPTFQIVIFTILFNRLAGIRPDQGIAYPVFAFSGIVIWMLFSTGLGHASNSLVENAKVITKVYFPRAVVPLSSVLVAVVDFLIGFGLLLVVMPFFGEYPAASILLAPVMVVMATACALAIGLWTSAINVQFRDVRYALPFFLQLLIYVTPVFYPATLVPEPYQMLWNLNPMAAIVDGFRASVFGFEMPWTQLGIAAAEIFVIGAGGFLYFRHMEHSFADRV